MEKAKRETRGTQFTGRSAACRWVPADRFEHVSPNEREKPQITKTLMPIHKAQQYTSTATTNYEMKNGARPISDSSCPKPVSTYPAKGDPAVFCDLPLCLALQRCRNDGL